MPAFLPGWQLEVLARNHDLGSGDDSIVQSNSTITVLKRIEIPPSRESKPHIDNGNVILNFKTAASVTEQVQSVNFGASFYKQFTTCDSIAFFTVHHQV
jgi:hypothetical protein